MNNNCLKGYRCPKCGSNGPFLIPTSALVEWNDDGTADMYDAEFQAPRPGFDPKWICKSCDFSDEEQKFELRFWNAEQVPCIRIPARDLLEDEDIRDWYENPENNVPRLFCGDIFTVYDNGSGPHCPGEKGMPEEAWDAIEQRIQQAGYKHAVIWLANVEEGE